jgi:uncharacterized membrane-anchored protein YjiN (DUF445 family)
MNVFLIVIVLLVVGWILKSCFDKKSQDEPGNIIISGVDTQEFSRVFAAALLDESGGKLLSGLLKISGNKISLREMAMLKFILGEEDNEFLVEAIATNESSDASFEEMEISLRQMELLESIVSSEEHQLEQEKRKNEMNLLDQIDDDKEAGDKIED